MAVTDIGLIAGAIKAACEVWYQWKASEDKRRLEAANEAAEKYIFLDEKSGEFSSITPTLQQKFKKHYRKRFFAYR